ncbi:LacI family transcriptional regulator [Uliginosibacterium sp. TH139]|nr:LacI family transcriptional regulator [Uliginosibacterium sp. TH139]
MRFVLLAWCASVSMGASAEKACIGVVPAGGGYAFWGEVGRGARQAGLELGLDIYFRGPSDENNPDAQKEILAVIAQKRCSALVLAPNVPERAKEVAQLRLNGVPTVYIDRSFGGSEAAAIVATDNYLAGGVAGREMARILGKHGRVVVFRMKRGVTSTDDRERGFMAAVKAAGLSVVLDEWIGSNVGEARTRSESALERLKQPFDGIFTPNESTTLATLSSLQKAGLAGKVRLIGFDMSKAFIDALNKDHLYGVVVQRPYQMGYLGVRIAYAAASGKAPEQNVIDPGIFFVTRSTLNSPGFAQDLEPFLKP